MAEDDDREELALHELQRRVHERAFEREQAGYGAGDEAARRARRARETALASFLALQERLTGEQGREPDFVDFRPRPGPPRITDVEPSDYVAPGQVLTIRGERMDLVRQVRIDGELAEPMAMLDQHRLVVVVPLDARDGSIELFTDDPAVLEPTWDVAGARRDETPEETRRQDETTEETWRRKETPEETRRQDETTEETWRRKETTEETWPRDETTEET